MYGKWGGIPPWNSDFFRQLQFTETVRFNATPAYLDPSFLRQKYVEERLSCKEIARLTFSARTTVLKHLKLAGIPVRGAGQNTRRWNQAYGVRLVKRRETFFKAEQENIEKMGALRDQGLSYWKIADVLNAMRVPTKTAKGPWQARTVQRILSKNLILNPSNLP